MDGTVLLFVFLIFAAMVHQSMKIGKAVTSNKRAMGIGMSLLERWLK